MRCLEDSYGPSLLFLKLLPAHGHTSPVFTTATFVLSSSKAAVRNVLQMVCTLYTVCFKTCAVDTFDEVRIIVQ